MTMTLPRLAASRSKGDFFKVLGWSENDEEHKRLYALMMEEAAKGRQRTSMDRANLTAQLRGDLKITEPYSSSQISETAKYREVQAIYSEASAETRQIYDYGTYQDGRNTDNWIIRWCLWHVFRYRDDRNRNRRPGNDAISFTVPFTPPRSGVYPPMGTGVGIAHQYNYGTSVSYSQVETTSRPVYDPARDTYSTYSHY